MDAVEDTVGSAVSHVLSEEFIRLHGRSLCVVLAGISWMATLQRHPADIKNALSSHLPQGLERSLLAARLQARRTKVKLNELLEIHGIREKLRVARDKEEKVRLIRLLQKRVLSGLLAGSYLHALTISLFCVKNSVRVLCFVRSQRAEKRLTGQSRGMLASWWRVGFKRLMLQKLSERMVGGQQGSPFLNDPVDEFETPGTSPRGDGSKTLLGLPHPVDSPLGAVQPPSRRFSLPGGAPPPLPPSPRFAISVVLQPWLPPSLAAAGPHLPLPSSPEECQSLLAALEEAFSVKKCIEMAMPCVLRQTEFVVSQVLDRMGAELGERMRNPTALVSEEDILCLMNELTAMMERTAWVEEWTSVDPVRARSKGDDAQASLLPATTQPGCSAVPPLPKVESLRIPPCEVEEEPSEIVKFDHLVAHQKRATEASMAAALRVTPKSMASSSMESAEDFGEQRRSDRLTSSSQPNATEEGRGEGSPAEVHAVQEGQDPAFLPFDAMGSDVVNAMAASSYASAVQDVIPLAECFQHVIHTVGFSEIVLAHGHGLMRSIVQESAVGKKWRKFDPTTGRAPLMHVITRMEELRQRHADDAFTIPKYLELFCTELIRCSCQE